MVQDNSTNWRSSHWYIPVAIGQWPANCLDEVVQFFSVMRTNQCHAFVWTIIAYWVHLSSHTESRYGIYSYISMLSELCQSTASKLGSLCWYYAAHKLLLHDKKSLLHEGRWFYPVQTSSFVVISSSFVKQT